MQVDHLSVEIVPYMPSKHVHRIDSSFIW